MQDDRSVMEKMFDNPPPKMGVPDAKDIARVSLSRIPCSHEDLESHLQKYVDLIKAAGANEARIISARDIPQDPRVMLKCFTPKCPAFGSCGGCPPHYKVTFQEAKEFLGAYKWAIVYRVDIPKEGLNYLTGPGSLDYYRTKEGRHRLGSFQRYCFHMGHEVERAAFYDGHYFAINADFGPCLTALCEEFDTCQAIKSGVCRFPTVSKLSPDVTFSIDYIKLSVTLGWGHYMMGFCPTPNDYPKDHVSHITGLILIE
jgi:predicted metal-binding protein